MCFFEAIAMDTALEILKLPDDVNLSHLSDAFLRRMMFRCVFCHFSDGFRNTVGKKLDLDEIFTMVKTTLMELCPARCKAVPEAEEENEDAPW